MFILSLIEIIQSGIFIFAFIRTIIIENEFIIFLQLLCINIISNFASILYKYEDFEYRISR